MHTTTHETPVGTLTLAADACGLRHIVFPQGSRAFRTPEHWQHDPSAFDAVRRQLDEYFAGERQGFSLQLAPEGTCFQRLVWQALETVDYARTCTYGELARRIDRPRASRAVGAANGANPIPIIIPCHRVIGAGGQLTGFGGGLLTKQWLLSHERGEGQLFGFDIDATSPANDQRNRA